MTQSPIEQAIKNAEQFNRRECFADSDQGMMACVEFGSLLTALRQHREDGVCVPKTGRFKFTNCTDLELPEEKQTCFITGTIEYAPPPQKENE